MDIPELLHAPYVESNPEEKKGLRNRPGLSDLHPLVMVKDIWLALD